MPGSGTRTFLEPDHYEASLRQAQIEILIALSPQFKARLTWAELHDLEVLRCEEDLTRVAYVCLSPQLSFVTFPAHSGPVPVWGGTELRPGEIVLHGRGERLHQSTPGSFVWNVIALANFGVSDSCELGLWRLTADKVAEIFGVEGCCPFSD